MSRHIRHLAYPILVFHVCSVVKAQIQKPELFLLSVGVEQYQDTSLNLNFCADDATDLATALQMQTDLYDVIEAKVLVNAQATRAAVRAELDAYKKKVTPNDLFVFIFSGHGIEDALAPFDYNNTDPIGSSLNKEDLRQKLNALGCNYLVLLDACHSGSFTKQVLGKGLLNPSDDARVVEQASRKLAEALADTDKNAIVVSSTASDQMSFECERCAHGYFAQAVLDCIAGNSITDPLTGRVISPQADLNGFLGMLGFESYLAEAVRIKTNDQETPQKVRVYRSSGGDFPILRLTAIQSVAHQKMDRDDDGIPDIDDVCPDDYSPTTANGCPGSPVEMPDADSDGVFDINDDCPFAYGPFTTFGCPDTDGDGIRDSDDVCPDQVGQYFDGCPDSDGDNIPDPDDKCPWEAGEKANWGCPEIGFTAKAITAPDTKASSHPILGDMVLVVGGDFQMGSAYGDEDEGPVHTVNLSDYYIGQTEVTQAQWRAVMGEVPAYFAGCDDCPVERVSWEEIQAFLGRLNNLSGANLYRLPTEAEWEYAARGGNQGRGYVFSGSNDIDAVAWHALNSSGRTHAVKGKMANELGLFDMTGNVWEWCVEWYKPYSEGVTAGTSRYRVNRGGSWHLTPRQSRVTYRDGIAPREKSYMLGFRVVREIPLAR